MSTPRTPSQSVHPQFVQRWSPRSFTGEAIDRQELMSLFEAARWAPSASNTQPWRFAYGLQGSEAFNTIFRTLAPVNQTWAGKAACLITVVSLAEAPAKDGAGSKPLLSHAFDTGAAWMSLALQAEHMGWRTHAMGGFDREALRQALAVPAHFALHCVLAIGRQGEKSALSAELQEREAPNARQPLSAMVCEGRFSFEA